MKISDVARQAFRKAWNFFLDTLIYGKQPQRYKKIPVVINNRDRCTPLQQLVTWLEQHGYETIYIIDNDSSYPPLLEYYKTCPHTVVRYGNLGHLALWKSPLFKSIRRDYYVYTDSDVVPAKDCPADVIGHFLEQLQQHPQLDKVGFSLAIDDLPDHYALKQEVIDWERKHWDKPLKNGLFDAPIDTTFALYRPFTMPRDGHAWAMPAYRTAPPYTAHHMPWYQDTQHFSEDELYYMQHASNSASWAKLMAGKEHGVAYAGATA